MPNLYLEPGEWIFTEYARSAPAAEYASDYDSAPWMSAPNAVHERIPPAPTDMPLLWPYQERWRFPGGYAYSSAEQYSVPKRAEEALGALRLIVEAARKTPEKLLGERKSLWRKHESYYGLFADRYFLKDESPLGSYFVRAAQRKPVIQAAVAFCQTYGPLVTEFAPLCLPSHEALPYRSRWDLSLLQGQPGREWLLWPHAWRQWVGRVTVLLTEEGCPALLHIPAPVALSVWAAYSLVALREHPEWGSSKQFLANRYLRLRLLNDSRWGLPVAGHLVTGGVGFPYTPRAGRSQDREDAEATSRIGRRAEAAVLNRRVHSRSTSGRGAGYVRVYGELLDYLALAVAFPRRPRPVESMSHCQECGELFNSEWDGRRHYCQRCRPLQGSVRAKRYRDKVKAESAPAT